MGTFTYPVTFSGPGGRVQIDALVDSGASYTVLPPEIVAQLGLQAIDRAPFELADGRVVEHDIGAVDAEIDGRRRPTLCVFGGEGLGPLLGAITLEAFLLGVDPTHKRLVPVRGLLMLMAPR